jgi:hypothetical protein
MERKIVRPSTQFIVCPNCGAQGKVVRHTRAWTNERPHEFIGSIRPKVDDASKVCCQECRHEFVFVG